MTTTIRRRIGVALLLPLVVLGLAACGSSDNAGASKDPTTVGKEAGGSTGTSSAAVLTIKSFKFSPTPLKVPAGATVQVMNGDGTDHTVTADDGKSFDTQAFQGKKTFVAPSEPGTYAFHCQIHDYMKGVIQVER